MERGKKFGGARESVAAPGGSRWGSSTEQIERHHFAPYPIDQRELLRKEDTLTLPVGTPLEEVERQMILRTVQKTKNNKTRAAELLGISLKTLHNKLNLYRDRGQLDEEGEPTDQNRER